MFTASKSHLPLLLGHLYNTDVSILVAYPVMKMTSYGIIMTKDGALLKC